MVKVSKRQATPTINSQHPTTDARKPGTNNIHRERRPQSTVSTQQPTTKTTVKETSDKKQIPTTEKNTIRSENSSILTEILQNCKKSPYIFCFREK
jgi:hypothetical protein